MTRSHTDKDQLGTMFAYIRICLQYNGRQGLLDENKILEDIMCNVLNRVYGWHLKNLNYEEKNFPGIDLGDAKSGLGVQVTSDKSGEKIRHTLSQILKHDVYQVYPKLKVLVMGEKQKRYSVPEWSPYEGKIEFDCSKDILDFSDVLEASALMEADARHDLVVYLQTELGWGTEQTKSRAAACEKVQEYLAEQKEENSYITVLGVQKKLPIEKAWMKLNIITEEELQKKQAETQWDFLKKYDEYSGRQNRHTYDVETLLLEAGNKVVLGGPGMGKSTLCKKLFCQAESMRLAAMKVRLWDVAGYMRGGCLFEEALRKSMTQSLAFDFDKEDLAGFFSVLILDGLDECGDYRRRVAKDIAAWGFGHPDQKIVVTSRPIGYDATELTDFAHYQILPIEDLQLETSSRQLMEMFQPDCEEQFQWFLKQIDNRELRQLACRSPLVLGFMVQLSLKGKEFGANKICLYEAIIEEWLQGSSRENEKPVSETELYYGIEAIAYYMMHNVNDATGDAYTKKRIVAYVGDFFAREMEYSSLKARRTAEQCLEFWLERGILDKGVHKEQECYLFLHLNVGEYLAARFLANFQQEEKKEWVCRHYRDNIWQETLRMAIACETDTCFVQELLVIEAENLLPEGAVFLAAEGIGESKEKQVPQELYDKLWEYAFGGNTYLAKKAAQAIDHLQGGKTDWHMQQLNEYVKSGNRSEKMVAYHIFFIALAGEKENLHLLARNYVVYDRNLWERAEERGLHNLEKAIQSLIPDPDDAELTDAMKNIPFDHLSMYELMAMAAYFDGIGESAWMNARYEELMGDRPDFAFEQVNRQMQQSEKKLIEILGELFGMTYSGKIETCHEYSKISAVMQLMRSYIPDLRWLGRDLKRPHSAEFVRAVCETVDLDQEQLKKELYSLLHYYDEKRTFISSDHTLDLHMEGNWARSKGHIGIEALKEGLYSHSDILGRCAIYMSAYNFETAAVKELLVQIFRTDPVERAVKRAGKVLSACSYENLETDVLHRLNCDEVPLFACLYQYLPENPSGIDTRMWLSGIRRGLFGDRYLAAAALKYILTIRQEALLESVRDALIDLIKSAYEMWSKKKIPCLNCNDGTIIDANGFCPNCHVGADVPAKYFVEVLSAFHIFTMEDYMGFCQHPQSDVCKIAKRELKKIWMKDQKKLESVIDGLKTVSCDKKIFDLILQLPADRTQPFRDKLQWIGMETNEDLLLVWLRHLRSLDWVSAEDRKSILAGCLSNECEEVQNRAMACWLGDTVYNW